MSGHGPFRARYGEAALVAGASEGIGAAFAEALACRGLSLVLAARRPGPLEALAARLRDAHGVRVRPVPVDVADVRAPEILARAAEGLEVGLLVHNAAHSPIGSFLDLPLEQHLRALDVGARAPLALTHRFAGPMATRGRGGVVFVSSLAAFQGSALVASYAAAKAAGLVLAEGLWDELRGRGVDVIACCAGATRTPGYLASTPRPPSRFVPRPLPPERVAEEALAALGRGPTMIPGRANRLASLVLRRLLTRRRATLAMGRATRRLYR